jgi:hypothetical protein
MSEVKVNKISPRSGTTVTLGDSGDTFTIPSGATINNQGTATNFGATGSASWTTTVKTSGFTAVAGEGYFVDTTSGAISVNLPAGTAGAVVAFKDYLNTFDTNALTLVQNGSDKIGGSTNNATLNTEGLAVTLVFIDSTQGWLVTDSGLQSEAPGPEFIVATGGTITTVCTNFKVHTFTGPGTFCVSNGGNAAGSNLVDYLVIAGGGGGAGHYGGGGGAGGYRESPGTASGSYAVSPLGTSPAVSLPVPAQGYPIAVGAGGAGGAKVCGPTGCGVSGSNSTFSTIISTAGGGGGNGSSSAPQANASPGGSGGGGGSYGPNCAGTGGTGNTPSVTPAQGKNGGNGNRCSGTHTAGGGGGGATVAGQTGGGCGQGGPSYGSGGAGATSSINATPTARAGGGGGSQNSTPTNPVGGAGGGGLGGSPGNTSAPTVQGTANTGGGAGGINGNNPMPAGGTGGSGIVIIRYKFQ